VSHLEVKALFLAESQNADAGFEFFDLAVALHLDLQYYFCGNDFAAYRSCADFEGMYVYYYRTYEKAVSGGGRGGKRREGEVVSKKVGKEVRGAQG